MIWAFRAGGSSRVGVMYTVDYSSIHRPIVVRMSFVETSRPVISGPCPNQLMVLALHLRSFNMRAHFGGARFTESASEETCPLGTATFLNGS